jgi:hypothetical protein
LIVKIDRFWLVCKPSAFSELADICFETDIGGLYLQFKGGLDPSEILAVYTNREEAQAEAERILSTYGKSKRL